MALQVIVNYLVGVTQKIAGNLVGKVGIKAAYIYLTKSCFMFTETILIQIAVPALPRI